jgi:hypothetical protein
MSTRPMSRLPMPRLPVSSPPVPARGWLRALRLPTAALLALVFAQACASGGTGERAPSRAGSTITAEEMQEAASGSDAWQVIERLRPAWLRQRAGIGSTMVFVNGQRYGDLNSLRGISVADLESARLLSAADATTLYGTGYPAGIIDLRTRRR